MEKAGDGRVARLVLNRVDDMHLHVRDGDALATTVPMAARSASRAIIMPNLNPPVTTTALASQYRQRILAHVPSGSDFTPLMTLYLTDQTTADDIRQAAASGFVFACKLYPCGATTNSASGVTRIEAMYRVFQAMAECALILLIHPEVTDPDVDIFDRERIFIERYIDGILRHVPGIKLVLEHITTEFAVNYVNCSSDQVAATITPHHLLENRNALFHGGLRPHFYCLPVLKSEKDRKALLSAATSGSKKFFMGTDSAPHTKAAKESGCCHAGCFVGFASIELYAEAFDSVGKLDKLRDFTSVFARQFYGLAAGASTELILEQNPWKIPDTYPFQDSVVVPFKAGEMLSWSLAR